MGVVESARWCIAGFGAAVRWHALILSSWKIQLISLSVGVGNWSVFSCRTFGWTNPKCVIWQRLHQQLSSCMNKPLHSGEREKNRKTPWLQAQKHFQLLHSVLLLHLQFFVYASYGAILQPEAARALKNECQWNASFISSTSPHKIATKNLSS